MLALATQPETTFPANVLDSPLLPRIRMKKQEWLFSLEKTLSKKKVWSQSYRKENVRFHVVPRKQVRTMRLQIRDYDRSAKIKGKHGGRLGAPALAVYNALADCINYMTGQLDPSYDYLCEKTRYCRTTVAKALRKLEEEKIITKLRRCAVVVIDGLFQLKQISNAYGLNPTSLWMNFVEPSKYDCAKIEYGKPEGVAEPLEQAAESPDEGQGGLRKQISLLALDEENPVAQALASLGSTLLACQDVEA